MKYSLIPPLGQIDIVSAKGGASPGAIMVDSSGERYLVKMGIPYSHGRFKVRNVSDVEQVIHRMSVKSCEEKIFFNIAGAIGGDNFQLPETDLVRLTADNYAYLDRNKTIANPRSWNKVFLRKFKLDGVREKDFEGIWKTIENIGSTEIVHIRSKMIDSYSNLSRYYNYHEVYGGADSDKSSDSRNSKKSKTSYEEGIFDPKENEGLEPEGIGSFFALSCCMGNNDCIGVNGDNVGYNPELGKLIVIDGGNMNLSSQSIALDIPASSNHSVWFSFRDLSEKAQKQACETFIRFASLNDDQLMSLITNHGQIHEVLGRDYIMENLDKLKARQKEVVKVFYNEMRRHLCEITPEVSRLNTKIEIENMDLRPLKEMMMVSSGANELSKKAGSPARKKPNIKGKPNLSVEIPEGIEESLESDSSKENYDIVLANGRTPRTKSPTTKLRDISSLGNR